MLQRHLFAWASLLLAAGAALAPSLAAAAPSSWCCPLPPRLVSAAEQSPGGSVLCREDFSEAMISKYFKAPPSLPLRRRVRAAIDKRSQSHRRGVLLRQRGPLPAWNVTIQLSNNTECHEKA